MLRTILLWLGFIADLRPVELSAVSRAILAQLDEIRDDVYRLTLAEWCAKWDISKR